MKPLRVVITFLIILVSSAMSIFASPIKRPDFSFPEKVSETARKEMTDALSQGRDVEALRAALNYTLAQNAIDSDRMPESLAMLDTLAASFDKPAPRAVTDLIRATIYALYYSSQAWDIDRRPAIPGGTQTSTDYTEWNTSQFEAHVCELLNSAMANLDVLLATPLRSYDPLLAVTSKDARVIYTYYPSLLDFVAGRAIELLSNFRTPSASALAAEYRATLLRLNADRPAPFIAASVDRILTSTPYPERVESLYKLYEAQQESQFSGEALITLGSLTDSNDIAAATRLKTAIDRFLARYPTYLRAATLRNILSRIVEPSVSISTGSVVVPGTQLRFTATAYNTTTVDVTLYTLPQSYNDKGDDYCPLKDGVLPAGVSKIASRRLTMSGTAPFCSEVSDSIQVDREGLYILVAEAPGMSRDSNPPVIRATSLSVGALTFGRETTLFVVNPLTGAPVANASLLDYREKIDRLLGTTDGEGLFSLKSDLLRDSRIRPVMGSDNFAPYLSIWRGGYRPDTARQVCAELYTDLGIYHPGDTMRFVGVTYYLQHRNYEVAAGTTVKATLMDANGTEVDTLSATTDRFGRIEGSMAIPDDGRLNGSYRLQLSCYGRRIATTNFMVSDYKLPTFEVAIDPASPGDGAVTLSGSAMTYTGMPVQGAEVKIDITREYRRFFADDSAPFLPFTLTATTDDSGRWSAVVDREKMQAAGSRAWLRALVTVTSSAGESQSASSVFADGSALRVIADLHRAIDISRPLSLPVKVVDPSGAIQSGVKIDYVILSAKSDTVATGSFNSDSPTVDWSYVAPGTYTISFTIEGDESLCSGIALYNPAVDISPSAELLWSPIDEITFSSEDTANILVGTSMETTHILVTLYDADRIISRRWTTLPAGLHTIPVKLEYGGSPDLRVSIMTTGRYTSSSLTISLKPKVNPRSLTIRAESMRDRALPGAQERWTFSVVNALGTPVESAFMADMYNKALDRLASSRWSRIIKSTSPLWLNIEGAEAGSRRYVRLNPTRNTGYQRETDLFLPQFQLYGQSLNPYTWRRTRGPLLYKASAMVTEESVMDEAAPMMVMRETKVAMNADSSPANGSYTGEVEMAEAEAGEGGAASVEAPFDYRDSATPLALFRPMLTTRLDGSLELSFTLPNANATWAFQALAFTDDMRLATFDATILASKPVMVKPNTPRFLRQGDEAIILTSVMNATDQPQQVEVTTELYNPLTGTTISTHCEQIDMEPNSTATVSANVEAAASLSAIGFRAKASTQTFTDGEQTIIPILPASQPVIDSMPFYMSPDTDKAVVILPAAPEAQESVATLEMCENPVWYVVTALPGLASSEPTTATEATSALFSALISRGLISRYPAIADALRDWTSRGADSEEITSMLERNQDLKTLLLNATPWMTDAMTDTERMRRLALLMDSRQIDNNINRSIELLRRLSRSEGGLAWIDSSTQSSYWTTTYYLSIVGTLAGYDFVELPARLADITSQAIAYLDAEAVKTHTKYPDDPQIGFASIRSMFPTVKASADVEAILARATERVVKDWKEWPLADKPQAALLLQRRGRHAVARDILASMREFMVTDPDKGTYFPRLQNEAWGYISYTASALKAFATIEPGAPEIDGLRHWLVVQKQATDWGSSPCAAEVVAAILSSSQSWLTPAAPATVKVNGRRLPIPATDSRLGYFRQTLSVNPDSEIKVDIVSEGHTPVWGALMRRSVAPIRSIEAASTPDISIQKSIIGPDTLHTGDKVTVRLVIHTERNLEYIVITDHRAACFEPVEQLPTTRFAEGLPFYIEPRDNRSTIFVTTMPKGTYVLSYDLYVNNAGTFASGIATVESQYAPEITARSGGSEITVIPASTK